MNRRQQRNSSGSQTSDSFLSTRLELVMKQIFSTIACAAFVVVLQSCATIRPEVPVHGDSYSIEALDGQWTGFYTSPETGRRGAIYFDLVAGADSASGEVVMYTSTRVAVQTDPSEAGQEGPDPRYAHTLSINFVRAANNTVSGQIDDYSDPDCGCTVYSTFSGEIDGDRITGTFITRSRDHGHSSRGTWEVTKGTR